MDDNSQMRVPLYRHNLHGHDLDAIAAEFRKVIGTMSISTGPVCERVQKKFANFQSAKHCLFSNNWTGAMIAALMSAGIKSGDEIIIPAMTFAGTVNAVIAVGARPVLVDIDPRTKLMDLTKVKQALTYRTKAVIPVHLYGQMVDILGLREIVKDRNCQIFEDAAHAIESRKDGYSPGTYSDAAIFSFYASKNITSGEGGAIVTNDDELITKFTTAYRHGIDLDGYKRHLSEQLYEPLMISAGIKANMTDMQALMLDPQIDNILESRAARERHALRYIEELSDLDIEIPDRISNSRHAWHLFAIGVDANRRSDILNQLDASGIRTTIHYRALNDMPYMQQRYGLEPNNFPIATSWGRRTISLPIFPDLKKEEQDHVIKSLRKII